MLETIIAGSLLRLAGGTGKAQGRPEVPTATGPGSSPRVSPATSMNFLRAPLIAATCLLLYSPFSSAAQYAMELVRVTSGSGNGSADATSLTTLGSWTYDDVAGTVTLAGTQRTVFDLSPAPNNDLFTHRMTDVVFDLDVVGISGAAYRCVEGQFGALVGASLCGNVNFGGDYTPQTTLDYATVPGTRVIGGDDVELGPQQQLSDYASALGGFNGSTLVIESPAWSASPGAAGLQLEFHTSTAPALLDIPDIRGQYQAVAEAAITAAGLKVGSMTTANDPLVPAGKVLSQNPLPCAACAMLNDAVNLVLSAGPEPIVTIPERIDALGVAVEALDLLRSRKIQLQRQLADAAYVVAVCSGDDSFASDAPWAKRLRRQIERLDNRPAAWLQRLADRFTCPADGGAAKAAAAIGQFLRLVNAYRGRGGIPAGDADALVADARTLIDEILFVPPSSGVVTVTSGGVQREYYLRMPSDYSRFAAPKPILIAFHGTDGGWTSWFDGGYYGTTLQDTVGNEAIIVFMQAQTLVTGVRQWDFATDFDYFQDVLKDVAKNVRFDTNRIFVTGHSSGGGFTHEIGCRFGNIVRAIAPHSGSLTQRSCTGAVAVMQIQGENDQLVAISSTTSTRDFWTLYNGFELDQSSAGTNPACRDFSLGNSIYPFQWCVHDEVAGLGHAWWSQASATMWTFFKSLPTATPSTAPPPGGGNDRVIDAFPARLDFTVHFPDEIPRVTQLVAVLYPDGTRPPFRDSPLWFLNLNIEPGPATPGTDQSYSVPIQLFEPAEGNPLPGSYTVAIVAYVEGGTFPIPAPGIDHIAWHDVTISDRFSPIVIGETLPLVPVVTE